MNIAIHGRSFKEDSLPYIQDMFRVLEEKGASIQIFDPFATFIEKKGIHLQKVKTYRTHKDLVNADFVLSVGGDGTLLEAVTFVREKLIPLLGINTGRLGFLATTQRDQIQAAVNDLYEGRYVSDDRSLIRLESPGDVFNDESFGLNEFTILKKDTSSMIVVHTYINGEYLNSYWADGLIISTPTGSTGYSLSCGGPLVLPDSNNLIIAPISPHNLNVRPMVVSDDSVISFKVEGRSKNILIALDSRSKSVPVSTMLKVKKEQFKARLVKLPNSNFFETLRSKLNWGLDLRN
jgi:NAD+ kinase